MKSALPGRYLHRTTVVNYFLVIGERVPKFQFDNRKYSLVKVSCKQFSSVIHTFMSRMLSHEIKLGNIPADLTKFGLIEMVTTY